MEYVKIDMDLIQLHNYHKWWIRYELLYQTRVTIKYRNMYIRNIIKQIGDVLLDKEFRFTI